MAWAPNGDAICDSCRSRKHTGCTNLTNAIQVLRAAGWHHFSGETIGGQPFEAMDCRACVKEEHKRPKAKDVVPQGEQLQIDWGTHD